jgi:hypothetical protein
LSQENCDKWRKKQVPYLERVITANLSKINFIMKTVRRNCRNGKLKERWAPYKSSGKGRKILLRFSKSGEETIEQAYATYFLKSKKKKAEQKPGDYRRQAAESSG